MDYSLVRKIVEAMELEKDDIVLLNFWGEESEFEDLHAFVGAVSAVGAMPEIMVYSSDYIMQVFGNRETKIPEKWYQRYDNVDVVIDIMNHQPALAPKALSKEGFMLFADCMQNQFGIFGAKKKFIQVTMPTDANADRAGMDSEVYKNRVLKALDIDYTQIKADCQSMLDSFEGNIRTVSSGKDCVLTVDTTDRKWFIDAGDGALPCGEIYVAPVEEKTNGTVYFETLSVEDRGVYHDVTVTIKDGRIVSSTCEEFNEFMKTLPEGGDIVTELGIGMNPNVDGVLGDSVLDENVVGTFHIAIGMNTFFGGKNACPVHMDFVTTGIVK